MNTGGALTRSMATSVHVSLVTQVSDWMQCTGAGGSVP